MGKQVIALRVQYGHIYIHFMVVVKQIYLAISQDIVHHLLSNFLGYLLDFEPLHFIYDRWLFTTVTGAISSARQFKTSVTTSSATKKFKIEH